MQAQIMTHPRIARVEHYDEDAEYILNNGVKVYVQEEGEYVRITGPLGQEIVPYARFHDGPQPHGMTADYAIEGVTFDFDGQLYDFIIQLPLAGRKCFGKYQDGKPAYYYTYEGAPVMLRAH